MSDWNRNAAGWVQNPAATRGQTVALDQGLRAFMLGVYNHMTLGLAISGFVALGAFMLTSVTDPVTGRTVMNSLGQALYLSPLRWVIMLAPLAFIFVFSMRIDRMSVSTATATFYAFAAIMGLSLSTIFFVFKIGSIVQVFFITAAAFAALSLFGYTTKKNLSAMGSFLIMGLVGLLIAGIVNIFLASSALQFVINAAGLLIFAGLTAWDTQRLKDEYAYVAGDATMAGRASVMGALSLYLNFINMFQFLLSFLGQRE